MSTATASGSLPTQTDPPSNGGSTNNGPTSSPLLFFVALGFGVVFTNLWYGGRQPSLNGCSC